MKTTDRPDPDDPRIIRGRQEFNPDPEPPWWTQWTTARLTLVLLAVAAVAITVVVFR